jgi:TPR repeat protein
MSQFEEDIASANKLLVEASGLMRSGETHRDVNLLKQALTKLKMVIELYPSTDLAAKLITGQDTGNISLKKIDRAIVAATQDSRTISMKKAGRVVGKAKKIFNDTAAKSAAKDAEYKRKELMQEATRKAEREAERKALLSARLQQALEEAEHGPAESQYFLGYKYHYGDGIPRDKAEAIKWYKKAAEQGHNRAMRSLRELRAE